MYSLLNIIIAAEKDVDGSWMQLIIPIVIVIVYAIGGIVKMKSNLKKDQPAEEPVPLGPAPKQPRYKPLDDNSHGWKHPNSRHAAPIRPSTPMPTKQDKQIERQLGPKKHTATPKQRNTLDSFLETQAPKPLVTRAAEAQAKAKEREKSKRSLALKAAQKRKLAQKPKPKSKFHRAAPPIKKPVSAAKKQPVTPKPTTLAELLKDHESIRTAIILKEILGKPIALRDY